MHSRAKGATVAVLRCVGARLPITIRRIDEEPADGKENGKEPPVKLALQPWKFAKAPPC